MRKNWKQFFSGVLRILFQFVQNSFRVNQSSLLTILFKCDQNSFQVCSKLFSSILKMSFKCSQNSFQVFSNFFSGALKIIFKYDQIRFQYSQNFIFCWWKPQFDLWCSAEATVEGCKRRQLICVLFISFISICAKRIQFIICVLCQIYLFYLYQRNGEASADF